MNTQELANRHKDFKDYIESHEFEITRLSIDIIGNVETTIKDNHPINQVEELTSIFAWILAYHNQFQDLPERLAKRSFPIN